LIKTEKKNATQFSRGKLRVVVVVDVYEKFADATKTVKQMIGQDLELGLEILHKHEQTFRILEKLAGSEMKSYFKKISRSLR